MIVVVFVIVFIWLCVLCWGGSKYGLKYVGIWGEWLFVWFWINWLLVDGDIDWVLSKCDEIGWGVGLNDFLKGWIRWVIFCGWMVLI